jgi:hypothetical protein
MSVESELKQVADGFISSAVGLFEITGQYTSKFEQGVYYCVIAKPSKRLRASLGVDREVLVVASNFMDQQQRSVKFARHEIDESNGRFESTLVIFVHNDPDGNSKLKNWGRNQGLSVLPLYRPELTSDPDDLERALCRELYSHDPFDVTGPVSDDTNFFGRRDEAINLARKLQKNQIRSCLGIRKIGKTSIINRVVQEITSNHDCICVMVDCSRDDIWSMDASHLLYAIGCSIKTAADKNTKYCAIEILQNDSSIAESRAVLETAVLQSGLPVIVIFDEVDYITPGSPTSEHWKIEFNPFWRNFRAIYQEISRQTKNLSVLVGGVSTYWFTVESIGGIENAALAFVPEEYLSPMQEGATIAMLKRLSKTAGLKFDESTYELIARASGNMPFWARKCCSWINGRIPIAGRPTIVEFEQAGPMVEAFAQEEGSTIASVALKHLFRVHPGIQDAAFLCAESNSSQVAKPLLRVLSNYGVIDKRNQVSAAMIAEGLKAIAIWPGQPAAQDQQSTEGTARLDDWAEDIAAISKRRNILERRMREMVLNWIRLDSTVHTDRGSTKDRLLAIIPADHRKRFEHVDADSVVGKLLWSQLTQLIEREWRIFGHAFGDKQRFHSNCDLINDRFDAHAKDADKADFALYRRALGEIEDRINRL